MTALAENFDAVLFDLDGVIYVGPSAIDTAPAAVKKLQEKAIAVGFVTNNASRTPAAIAQHLQELGIGAAQADVMTSAQAVARVMRQDFPEASPILVIGSDALAAEIKKVGLCPTRSLTDNPVAVVQGYNPLWSVRDLQDCCEAIHSGLPWYASNDDRTIPTERGIMPGMGTWISVVTAATGKQPYLIAGKPHRPLMETALDRLGCGKPLFVGDRLDTDIMGATALNIESLFVLGTGAHHKQELIMATQEERPTYLGFDVSALWEEPIVVKSHDQVKIKAGQIVVPAIPPDLRTQLQILAGVATAFWADESLETGTALAQLNLIP
ncbi:MAG: HAD-IIA family hydrolase [Propionibacteriaceae bacterium]